MVDGFGLCNFSESLLFALVEVESKNLTVISNIAV